MLPTVYRNTFLAFTLANSFMETVDLLPLPFSPHKTHPCRVVSLCPWNATPPPSLCGRHSSIPPPPPTLKVTQTLRKEQGEWRGGHPPPPPPPPPPPHHHHDNSFLVHHNKVGGGVIAAGQADWQGWPLSLHGILQLGRHPTSPNICWLPHSWSSHPLYQGINSLLGNMPALAHPPPLQCTLIKRKSNFPRI